MNRGVHSLDLDAVQEAVEALREAGYAVDGVDEVARTGQGVEFSLNVYASSRANPLGEEEREFDPEDASLEPDDLPDAPGSS